SASDLSSIQDEIKSRLSEIDRVSGQTQFNGVNVLAKDGKMDIQVGANDGQTITIDLKKIDSATLGLTGFDVQKSGTISTEAVATSTTPYTDGANTLALKATDLADTADGTTAATVTFSFDKATNAYFAVVNGGTGNTVADGTYSVTVDATGEATLGASTTAPGTATAVTKDQVAGTPTSTPVAVTAAATTALTAAGVTGSVELVKLTSTDSAGNATAAGYGLKAADGKIYATDYNGANATTFTVKTATYTDASGNPQTSAITLGGKDGKTELVTVGTGADAKTYNASELQGADLSSSTNTVKSIADNANPLKALDAAIASVDKFRSSLGAVQNQLNSAITNLNNTTTNLSEAQSRIQDADYATEVSNMSKAQIIQQAGNSVLAKANQVPQQVLSLLQG
ncbi:flagellin, partial [Leclercia adecarboxylata]|uniref:flagellin n=1 Tax=Leclercia adecarboxylata TaxID=83655 RepID=UPI00370B375C